MSDFATWKKVKARKPHRCAHCQCEIAKGVVHQRFAGVIDGDFQTYREHEDCYEAFGEYWDAAGLVDGDCASFMHEWEPEDRQWLADRYPDIHARMILVMSRASTPSTILKGDA